MYQNIRTRKSVPTLYEDKLLVRFRTLFPICTSVLINSCSCLNEKNEEVIRQEEILDLRSSYKAHLGAELSKADAFVPTLNVLKDKWSGMVLPNSTEAVRDPETGAALETLKEVGRASVQVPEGFVNGFAFSEP